VRFTRVEAPVYVLVSPARNEARSIELTIKSVVRKPCARCVVIVSDGSTDGTDDIVRKYAAQHDWIDWCGWRSGGSAILPAKWEPSAPSGSRSEFALRSDGQSGRGHYI